MIYDCFTFFNEFDLLEIRLNILDPIVDKFVLVEATQTHQGKDKPLYFSENKKRYEKFLDRIIHVVVDEFPDFEGKAAWVLEHHQRDMIMKGLNDCKADDIILISDVDEIPNPEKIIEYKNKKGMKIFMQHMYYYYMNCVNNSLDEKYRWNGSIMVEYKDIHTPQYLRYLSINVFGLFRNEWIYRWYACFWKFFHADIKGEKIVFVFDGGWHFSFLGGAEAIIKKLEAFAHAEYNLEKFKDAKSIEDAINSGKDILGRNFSYRFVPLDKSFPKYVLENLEKYKHLLKINN